jgi:hypothetical protein
MLDTNAVQQLIEQQINKTVNEQIKEVLATNHWMESLENKIINYTKDRIVSKFANSSALPEIVEAVKSSVGELFASGQIPGIEQYVDNSQIQHSIDQAVEQLLQGAVDQLGRDTIWLARIEHLINQAVVQRTVAGLGAIDVKGVINQRVDESLDLIYAKFQENFATAGIIDQATELQLTVLDGMVVVENDLTTRNLHVIESAVVQDLVVKGSINTDNRSWQELAAAVSSKTLENLSTQWKEVLIQQVKESIVQQGINFKSVTVDNDLLISDGHLSSKITNSKLQTVGALSNLTVRGEASIYDTLIVKNNRIGINTQSPEMALSVWDEEVSVIIGKHKSKQAYIGTSRDQGIAIGVNRTPQIEIDAEGLTRIKKLQINLHKLSHDTQAPGWSGTRGDLVFNTNPGPDRVFAWVCLGAHKWQSLKSAE